MQAANQPFLRLLSYLELDIQNVVACSNNANIKAIQKNRYQHASKLTLTSSSADVDSLFIAVFGSKTSGHKYIHDAAQHGCELALVETNNSCEHGKMQNQEFEDSGPIICIFIYGLGSKLADLAYCFYTGKLPGQQLNLECQLPKITAITGTNGKTSVASFIAQLCSMCEQPQQEQEQAQKADKNLSASIGTLGVNIFTKGKQTKLSATINTTPDVVSLIGTLTQLKALKCSHVALEASSHGLSQNRLEKLQINCAVFTNLTQDHLDYHITMAHYSEAKRKLLLCQGLSHVVLNGDDEESLVWQADVNDTQSVYWFSLRGLKSGQFGCWASDISYSTSGINFILHTKLPSFESINKINAPLIGTFNVANLIASITALLVQGYSHSSVIKAAHRVNSVAGRMELFTSNKASVLVDYAHTPDALKQALLAARVHTTGKLSCIFGCGGDRDKSKRSIMGGIAKQYADNIVLTQDNSRTEDPLSIIADIQKGIGKVDKHQSLCIELDRQSAIERTLAKSCLDDMIVVAGKGHEEYLEINHQRIAYNEREVVAMLTASNQSLNSDVNTNTKNLGDLS